VAVEAHLTSPRTDGDLKGHVGAEPPYVADLVAQVRNTSLDPFLRVGLPSDTPLTPGIVASGGLSLRGPLQRPLEVAVETALTDLQVLIPEYPVHNVGPMRFTLEEGRLALRDVRVAGEGTNLVARGDLSLLADGPLDLDVQGAADLRSLAAITRRVKARGDAVLNLALRGTRDAPRLDGQLELKGGGVRVRDFPHGLEEVHGAVHFTEQAAQLHDVVARLGGGEVAVDGQASYARAGLTSVDLSLSGHDIALRYPEGLRSLSDVELRVFGDGRGQWVTGNIDVRQAVWTRRYDVASELLSAERPLEAELPLHEGVRFDVTINAPGTLKVDNNLGALEASADLRLQGTSDNPVLLGRAEVEHGRVYFQGNTYTIRTGRMEFANPQRLDPYFEIEAETRLRSYRVNLKMTGTLERVYPTLRSDPPLSAVQILSLLAGGNEQDVASLAQTQTDQARLAAAGAASLAAGRLSEQVGLEREAERFFGLNRFSIDPSLLKSGVRNPAARLTMGKRIGPDLNVLYSIDLHGNDERLLSVEYSLPQIAKLADKGASVLLTRSDADGLGFDVRIQYSR
jgi:autotransporter translocation and assembly factor TamB